MAGTCTYLEATEQYLLSDGGHAFGLIYWVWGGITGDKQRARSQERSREEGMQVKRVGRQAEPFMCSREQILCQVLSNSFFGFYYLC